MSAQQTTYNLELVAPSQPGHVSDSHPGRIRPFRNDNVANIGFGLAVCRSSNTDLRGFDTLVTTRQFIGVTTWGQSQEAPMPGAAANDGIAPTEMNGILEQGEILVPVTEAVTPDSAVRVVITGADKGKFCTVADSVGHSTAAVTNAKYVSGTAGAGVAKVLLNIPGPVLLTAD